MDAFLSANQSTTPWKGEIEAGYDVANDKVDIFKIRQQDPGTNSTKLGDYRGGHLQGGVAITPRLWLDGTLWQRKIDSSNFQAKVDTWQIAAQYKVLEGAGYMPSVALRVGAWGNQADELRREKNITVAGVVLKSARITDPSDQQFQVDAIATWPISKRTELTTFAGAGTSRVTFNQASATTTQNGCLYNLSFESTRVVGTCDTATMHASFSTPNSVYGIDVNNEAKYSARYIQAGLMTKWRTENWQLRAGYQFQHIQRDHVDAIVESRGGTAYKNNHILVADVSYKLFKKAAVFLRGQYMSNQFNGEMPMAYNTLTASNYNLHYGMVSTGLIVAF